MSSNYPCLSFIKDGGIVDSQEQQLKKYDLNKKEGMYVYLNLIDIIARI